MTVSVPTNTLNKDFVAKYKLSQSVRSGGFGRVYKVNSTDETKKSDSVVKFIYKSKIHQLLDNEETEFFKNCSCLKTLQPEKLPYEILILKKLNHENIIKCLQHYQDDNFFYLIMEDHKSSVKPIDTGLKGDFINFLNSEAESEFWLKGQNSIDLFDCMERYHRLDENITKYIFRQVANVTKYLQDNNIFHGDIKEENILINRNLQIKLVDFGSAHYITKNNCNTTANNLTGSLSFFPPEVIKGELIQDFFKIDIWCLGILLFGLLYGTMPFSSSEQIIKDDFHADETLTFSEDCMNLLRLLLKKIPSERPNPQQILDSCWLKN